MSDKQSLFEEKQYLGYNKLSFLRRMVLALFCFLAYYWSEEQNKSGELFFFMGIAIIVISAPLIATAATVSKRSQNVDLFGLYNPLESMFRKIKNAS